MTEAHPVAGEPQGAATGDARRVPPCLVVLSPGTLQRARGGSSEAAIAALERAAAAAISGGVRALIVREPSLEDGAFLELALRLRARLDDVRGEGLSERGWLGVHDRLHLAGTAGADAVHLGGTSLAVGPARSVVGSSLAIGASSHLGDTGDTFAGADYLLHAPVFEPTSKSGHGRVTLGWSGAADFAASTDVPVLALGGVTAEHLTEAEPGSLAALHGVALIGGLWGTGPESIDGTSRSLADLGGISRRATDLVAACARHFSVPVAEVGEAHD
ncbi:Thiamine-phosphate synthase [Planctomycetes bacterium Poly30]|uniref:Thiamine-phosphate synthase n=1 Tax=Saltatorellus ferox TaxID=2528018 RepID=A0A518ETH6_9BACT|nr:Thiamine-phosphate synthase [Planctomycetes bacterium Poly30]